MREVIQRLAFTLLMFACTAGALAASREAQQPANLKAMFPTYVERSQNPQTWDAIAKTLNDAGVHYPIAAIRVRQTALWSAHVDLKPVDGQPSRRAVVSSNMNNWKILCLTSATEDCSKYGH